MNELREKINKMLPCIQEGCDQNGTIPEQDPNNPGEWQPAPCEFCYKIRFPFLDKLEQLLLERDKEVREGIENIGNEPIDSPGRVVVNSPVQSYQNGYSDAKNDALKTLKKTMTTLNKQTDNKISEEIKIIREAKECILAFRCLMQVQMTDNSEGEKYNAVPETMVNNFFKILEKKTKLLLHKKHQEDINKKIRQFQLVYGNFNSSNGILVGYKTNENGDNPVDILINNLQSK